MDRPNNLETLEEEGNINYFFYIWPYGWKYGLGGITFWGRVLLERSSKFGRRLLWWWFWYTSSRPFWGVLETRPYMRVQQSFVCIYFKRSMCNPHTYVSYSNLHSSLTLRLLCLFSTIKMLWKPVVKWVPRRVTRARCILYRGVWYQP